MRLTVQRRLAAQLFKGSPKRVRFDENALADIKEAITKQDLRGLIRDGIIIMRKKQGISRGRVRRDRRQNEGSRKGKSTARTPHKRAWINRIRIQRRFLRELRAGDLVDVKLYRKLALLAKGGYFRSKRHIKLYLDENKLWRKRGKSA